MQKIKPLKRFGQNYLTDKNILHKIIEEISPQQDDNLIEIGPGLGILTEELFKYNPNLTSIEIDNRVIEGLSEKFPGLKLINDDFLNINLNNLYEGKKKLRVVGNIPYNLTSPIIFKMIDSNKIIDDSVLTVQLEVAKRLTAKKGSRDYSILSVILQRFADVRICFKVSGNVFFPKPNVDSAVIHIKFKEINIEDEEKNLFIKIVKSSFGNRRKTLKNSLSNSIFESVNFFNSGVNLALRAEQLEIEDFIKLTKFALTTLRIENANKNSTY